MEIQHWRILLLIGVVFCLTTPNVNATQGRAVFYSKPYTPSKCFGNQNNGNLVAGVSDALWENGRACGKILIVSCIGGINQAPHPCKNGKSVAVKVVDYCEEGCQGIINLSEDAFNVIADTSAGIVKVNIR
ncbi:hypothetical protein ACFE04_008137 [Oxalis oulophora]